MHHSSSGSAFRQGDQAGCKALGAVSHLTTPTVCGDSLRILLDGAPLSQATSADPLAVYVYTPLRDDVFGRDEITADDVRIEAWCELYSQKEAAERVAAAST